MKTLNNLNTLKALIRDEDKASGEYAQLSRDKNLPMSMRRKLEQMSEDEAQHKNNLMQYKSYLMKKR